MSTGFVKPPESYWLATTPQTNHPPLTDDLEVDIAIIGGGMVGITSAYLLALEGYKIALIEADRIIQGTTGHTTAKITSQHNLFYYKIKSKLDKQRAGQYADANESAVREISRIIRENKIACDFSEEKAFVFTQQDEYLSQIRNEVNTASELGIQASFVSEIPLPIKIKGAVCFENQAQFHPRKYLLALAKEAVNKGAQIFEKTRAVDIIKDTSCSVVTDKGKSIRSSKVIIASHYPFFEDHGLYFSRIYPERSYILGIRANERFPGGMYITAEDPTRSLRAQNSEDGELILVAGEHHKTGQGEDMANHYYKLKDFAEQVFTVQDIPYRWSTQDYTTMDEIPYIGYLTSDTPNILVATGFNKWGMSNSMVAGLMFRDMLVRGRSPWEEVYSPSRFTPSASAKNFITENLNVAKELISGKISPVPDNLEIDAGEGRIVDIEGERAGVYKDPDGNLLLVDTTCTHMGCELMWNSAEKSWDCPCHGSRFTTEGSVITGPALKDLNIIHNHK